MDIDKFGKSTHEYTLEVLMNKVLKELQDLNSTVRSKRLSGATKAVASAVTGAVTTTRPPQRQQQQPPPQRQQQQPPPQQAQRQQRQRPAMAKVAPVPRTGSSRPTTASESVPYLFVPWFIRELCSAYSGRTITIRAIADLGSTVDRTWSITEAKLKQVCALHPQVCKLVKTDNYEDSVYTGNNITIQPNTHPHRKRLSAIKIY